MKETHVLPSFIASRSLHQAPEVGALRAALPPQEESKWPSRRHSTPRAPSPLGSWLARAAPPFRGTGKCHLREIKGLVQGTQPARQRAESPPTTQARGMPGSLLGPWEETEPKVEKKKCFKLEFHQVTSRPGSCPREAECPHETGSSWDLGSLMPQSPEGPGSCFPCISVNTRLLSSSYTTESQGRQRGIVRRFRAAMVKSLRR